MGFDDFDDEPISDEPAEEEPEERDDDEEVEDYNYYGHESNEDDADDNE